MVYDIKGNLLEADVQYICHQVNCQGVMGSGIAKQIRDRWPIVYDKYQEIYMSHLMKGGVYLQGHSQIVPIDDNKKVINMFAQLFYGYDGKRYTSYDAFWACLGEIKEKVPKGSKIGFPVRIGCGLGGANWSIIRTMIEEVLGQEYEVYIYHLEDNNEMQD